MSHQDLSKMNIVFDSLNSFTEDDIRKFAKRSKKIFIIEPFIAFHHKKSAFLGSPQHFPDFVKPLLDAGIINLISAEKIAAKEIYFIAADLAVGAIESAFPLYEARFKSIFNYVQVALGSSDVVNAFKNSLCQQLAEFYAFNILLHRIQQHLPNENILFYADVNIRRYHFLSGIVRKSRQQYFDHSSVSFFKRMERNSFIAEWKAGVFLGLAILLHSLLGIIIDVVRYFEFKRDKLKTYNYGIALVAPGRQLKTVYGRVDFIVDQQIIKDSEVIYFPLTKLTAEQKNLLSQLPGEVFPLPNPRNFFSNGMEWLTLFRKGLFVGFQFNSVEIKTAYLVLSRYFIWRKVLEKVQLKHFVTHCDFGINHIGRNIALQQSGVQTWHFTDSMNFGCNLLNDDPQCPKRHPFWTFLMYDHYVTWNEFIKKFIQSHPVQIKNYHVVGCLWSQTPPSGVPVKDFNFGDQYFVIGAFDTTFSLNGYASYEEGIIFAEHLMDLVEKQKDIVVLFKEKKDRMLHAELYPDLAAKFVATYDAMAQHPRIKVLSRLANTGEMIDHVDMVISFPFTSTTFDALSRGVPAVWHDPLSCYQDTPYGKLGNVMTHGFVELVQKVEQVRSSSPEKFFEGLDRSSHLLDPFSDRKSVDRFRRLLS